MLKLIIAQNFTLLLQVSFPSSDPRKPNSGSFTARYKDMDRSELKQLSSDYQNQLINDDEMLDRILDAGDAIGGIGDGDTLYAPERQRELVYARLPLARAVINGFFDHVGGHQGKSLLQSRAR